jgi:hypothetical protein
VAARPAAGWSSPLLLRSRPEPGEVTEGAKGEAEASPGETKAPVPGRCPRGDESSLIAEEDSGEKRSIAPGALPVRSSGERSGCIVDAARLFAKRSPPCASVSPRGFLESRLKTPSAPQSGRWV